MKAYSAARTCSSLLAIALAGMAAVPAQAENSAPWQYQGSIYGWLPSIDGTASFPMGGSGSATVDSDQVIDSLDMAFMATFGAKKGRWGLWTDFMYTNLEGSKQGTLGFSGTPNIPEVGASADMSLDIKALVWTITGTYELAKTPTHTADLLIGARLLDVEQTLDWSVRGNGSLGLSANGSAAVSADNWDGIIGVKGVAYFGNGSKWFVPYYLDVGTGQSDLTWQANIGIGYRYNWGALVASWRYLDYDLEAGSNIQEMTLSGPLVGVAFQW